MSKERFGAVDCGLWKHKEFKKLDDNSKLLFLYLKTCDHQNMIGCFHMPIGYITVDIKWSEKRVIETLCKLFDKGFARHCEESEYVLLPKHLRKHPLQNINQGKGAASLFDQVPKDFIYINDLAEILLTQTTLEEPFANRLKTLCNSVSVTNSVTNSVTPPEQPLVDSDEPTAVFNFKQSLIDLGVSKVFADDFMVARAKKKSSNTLTAFNGLVSQFEKAGLSANDAIKISAENSWAGFKADWLNDKNQGQTKATFKTMSDSQLMSECEKHSLSTMGLDRWSMIDKLEARA